MVDVAIFYGMTETSPVSTMPRNGDTLQRRTATVGRTMTRLESRVIDPGFGEVLERGRIGELCTRGYAVLAGYWGQRGKTAQAIDADGWMHTGDLARMDEAAVAEFCRGNLAHYKIPRYVDVRASFPMTVSGKMRKVEMREEAAARLGLRAQPAGAGSICAIKPATS